MQVQHPTHTLLVTPLAQLLDSSRERLRTPLDGRCLAHAAVHPASGGEACAEASRSPAGKRGNGARTPEARGESLGGLSGSCSGRVSLPSGLMAFAPMGPEASFFEAVDQHRASLLAALRRGSGEPAGAGTRMASRYRSSARAREVESANPPSPGGGVGNVRGPFWVSWVEETKGCFPGVEATGRAHWPASPEPSWRFLPFLLLTLILNSKEPRDSSWVLLECPQVVAGFSGFVRSLQSGSWGHRLCLLKNIFFKYIFFGKNFNLNFQGFFLGGGGESEGKWMNFHSSVFLFVLCSKTSKKVNTF